MLWEKSVSYGKYGMDNGHKKTQELCKGHSVSKAL